MDEEADKVPLNTFAYHAGLTRSDRIHVFIRTHTRIGSAHKKMGSTRHKMFKICPILVMFLSWGVCYGQNECVCEWCTWIRHFRIAMSDQFE